MDLVLVGAELEEDLGPRYVACPLEGNGHQTAIVPFKSKQDAGRAIETDFVVCDLEARPNSIDTDAVRILDYLEEISVGPRRSMSRTGREAYA